jgi:membrane protease YdiL (CAAX protease family)
MALTVPFGAPAPTFAFVRELLAQPIGIPVVVILYAVQAWLEELGWRGYFLDRVRALWGVTGAALGIGLIHGVWHLPTFFIVGTNQMIWGLDLDFLYFVAFVVSTSVYSTWCYYANKRSTMAVALLHAVGNLSLDAFFSSDEHRLVYWGISFVGAAVLVIVWRARGRRAQGPAER